MSTLGNINDGPICIIGMHRSGTSMVANLLRLRGLSLGSDENLMGGSGSNEFGHFEHTGFVEINEALLKQLGGSWDNPPILQRGWEAKAELSELDRKARLLVKEFSTSSAWGWKDPRTTILLTFWQRIIPNLRYVICIRNPLEVALSLAQRDGQSIPAAVCLWQQYTRQAIRDTEGCPRLLTFYENYFRQPAHEVTRISEFCGLRNTDDSAPIQATIARELRHYVRGAEELVNDRDISLEAKLLYLMLRALPPPEQLTMHLDHGSRKDERDGMNNVLRLVSELHEQDKVLQLEKEVGEKEQQLNVLRVLLRKESCIKDEKIVQLQEQNARLQDFADRVRDTLAYRLYRLLIKPIMATQASRKI